MSLLAESVSFAYHAGRPVLTDVTARIEGGRVTVVLGPNGSGKTTLLRLLLGLRRPDAGRATLDGQAVADMSERRRAARLAYMSQRPALAFAFSVREVVALGRHALGGEPAVVEEAMARAGVSEMADRPAGELSVGQQQLVALARALAQLAPAGPGKVLLADEPLAPLDPAHAQRCRDVLRELAGAGVGVGVVVHDVTAATILADEAIVLNGSGRVAAQGGARETCTPELLSEVYGVGFERARGSSGVEVLLASPGADSMGSR